MLDINGARFYTAREFAESRGVSKSYICRLAREGKIPAQKTALGWLIPASVDAAWISSQVQNKVK